VSRFAEIRDHMETLFREVGARGSLVITWDGAELTMIIGRPGSGLPPYRAVFDAAEDFDPEMERNIIADFSARVAAHFGDNKQ
jgi:hypothetical protein